MPSIYQLKPAFQNALRPVVKVLYRRGVNANQVTLLAMLISVILAVFFIFLFFNPPNLMADLAVSAMDALSYGL
ncbi:hypothetical protein EC844_11781 [Acinetobacter calcoaceticus]|uniref:Uncharacterized protein n=1 Tax=Acinetobacter calcoaceticus TaxID=471 RepID=A0A4R1XQE4_ACICA|nr:hypothetical protein EC844_11781 [Acinetobacter calcoaceticus]